MVSGDTLSDIRIRHKGNIVDNVIEGAFRVLEEFDLPIERFVMVGNSLRSDIEPVITLGGFFLALLVFP